jgi:transcriptional regulator with XRE-family HTH domain
VDRQCTGVCFAWFMAVERAIRYPRHDIIDLGLEIIGRGVLRARIDASLTQRRLEDLSGVDQSTISRLENGNLSGLRLARLAAIVGTLNGFPLLDDRTYEDLAARHAEIAKLARR